MQFIRRIFLILFFLSVVACGLFIVIQIVFILTTRSQIVDAGAVADKQIAIVLGASVKSDGEPSDILADRLITALELYREGRVQKFLLSGDHGTTSYDEVKAMRDFLLGYGVAPEDLFLDHAGFDTYDSLYRARFIFGVTDAVIVTQGYHLPRALITAKAVSINAQGVKADRQRYVKMIYFQFRELFARLKALSDIIFNAESATLGEPISIEGDGRVTWDDL